jgi:6-phospho-beta-glucosidase
VKITVIGGGSSYTPELVSGFLARFERLPLDELCLMDIDAQRLQVVGGFAQRIVQNSGAPFHVSLSQNRRRALSGASFVITQLRVGRMPARRGDEYLGKRHGLIGQETTGVGGMAKALRTIPVLLDIAQEMQELAPHALLLNFTNPAGLLTEALTRYAPDLPVVGVCNVGITTKMRLIEQIEQMLGERIDPSRAILYSLGLNHLTWHRALTLDGEDVWPRLFPAYLENLRQQPEPEWDIPLLESLGMIPNYYLHYFYNTAQKLQEQGNWPPSRAEQVMEIEQELLRQYAEPGRVELPEGLMQRGGAHYSTLATELIEAHYNNTGQVYIVNIPNQGAVKDYPADWVLELPARVDRSGIHPLPAQPLPQACSELVERVKAFELLTVQAAAHGDRQAALQALLAHPLGPPAEMAEHVLADLLQTNRRWLPQFNQ